MPQFYQYKVGKFVIFNFLKFKFKSKFELLSLNFFK